VPGYTSVLINGPVTVRCDRKVTIVSSGGATRLVDQVPDTDAFAYRALLRAHGCEESAEQPVRLEVHQPSLPTPNTTS
jgi:hypothetical protein